MLSLLNNRGSLSQPNHVGIVGGGDELDDTPRVGADRWRRGRVCRRPVEVEGLGAVVLCRPHVARVEGRLAPDESGLLERTPIRVRRQREHRR